MNRKHEQYATWDAAYALGALSAHERAEFEAHLAGCEQCRAAVAELVSTAALLSRLSAEDAERISQPPVDDAPVRLHEMVRRRRRARRRTIWAAAGFAAALVIAVPVGIAVLTPRPAVEVALAPAAYTSATATVQLTPTPWGTDVEMSCTYDATSSVSPETYILAVVSEDGTATTLSTWRVAPGVTARVSAGTALPLKGIRSVEVRDAAGRVVLRHDLG